MKTLSSESIHPIGDGLKYSGLTKREYFAAMAMQGLIAQANRTDPNNSPYLVNDGWVQSEIISKCSVEIADALIKELNK